MFNRWENLSKSAMQLQKLMPLIIIEQTHSLQDRKQKRDSQPAFIMSFGNDKYIYVWWRKKKISRKGIFMVVMNGTEKNKSDT